MRARRLLLAPLLLTLAACSTYQPPRDPHTIVATTTSKGLEGRTTLGMPITLRARSTIIVPFAIESEKDMFQTRDPFIAARTSPASSPSNSFGLATTLSEGDFAGSIGGGGSVRWHNAIFRDLSTGEEWPLLDRRGIVSSWYAFNLRRPAPEEGYESHVLVFLATLEDTNHDGLLNDLDARVAILTDADGRHPRIVSPSNAQIWNVTYDPQSDRVFLLVVADTNHDGQFDFNDAPTPYATEARGANAAPVVSREMLGRVESLLK